MKRERERRSGAAFVRVRPSIFQANIRTRIWGGSGGRGRGRRRGSRTRGKGVRGERGEGVAGRGERRERKARGCQRDALKATSSRQYTHHFAPRDARTMPAINAVFAISPREEARDTFRSRRATTDISPLVRQYLSSLLHSPPLAPPSSPSVSPSALASLALPPAFPGRLDLA